MKTLRHLATVLLWVGLLPVFRLEAATREESEAFNVGGFPFLLGDYKGADAGFGRFVELFPKSERRAEAVLRQAQARYELGRFADGIELLTNSLAQAGDWSGDYLYWLGMSQLGIEDAPAAAATLERVSQATTDPVLRRRASIGEGKARFIQGDYTGVVEVLGAKDSLLQTGLDAQPNAEPMVQGQLMLAEALLKLRRFRELESALERFSKVTLRPELEWHRLWLRAAGQREEGDLTGALTTASNLVAVGVMTGRQQLMAEGVAFLGSVHRQLGHPTEAVVAFRQNLTTNAPAPARKQSLVNLISLQLENGQFVDATNELQNYTTQFPQESNVWSLVLGDLQLREYARLLGTTNSTSGQLTQLLAQAHATLAKVSGTFTNSELELEGRAQLLLGWCFWEERNFEESGKAFQAAVAKLSPSADRLLARFKLADVQLKSGAATNAAATYRQLVTDIASEPDAQGLVEPLLYQWLRACIQIRDADGAEHALQRLMQEFPRSQKTENGFMMSLQSQGSDPAGARAQYQEFSSRFPHSPLLPEVELMIAQFHERERDWTSALKQYDEWLTQHGENTNRPYAEYSRAMCLWRAGEATNALISFTNFVACYPTNPLMPLALQWLAEDYLRKDNRAMAQEIYEKIFKSTNWLASAVTIRAGLGAARAAFLLQKWPASRDYLTNVVSLLTADSNAPPELTAQAYLMLGDTILEQYFANERRIEDSWRDAMKAYQLVLEFGTNEFTARAWGRIGAGYRQHGENGATNDLAKAMNAWQQVIDLKAAASVELRSQAEVAIGMTLESLAGQHQGKEQEEFLEQARSRYGNVIHRNNLLEGEMPNPLWYKEAAMAGAQLALRRGEFRHAQNLCNEALRQFSWLHAEIDPLLEKAKAGAAAKSD